MNKLFWILVVSTFLIGVTSIVALNRMVRTHAEPKIKKWSLGTYASDTLTLFTSSSPGRNSTSLIDGYEACNFDTKDIRKKVAYIYEGDGFDHEIKNDIHDLYIFILRLQSSGGILNGPTCNSDTFEQNVCYIFLYQELL